MLGVSGRRTRWALVLPCRPPWWLGSLGLVVFCRCCCALSRCRGALFVASRGGSWGSPFSWALVWPPCVCCARLSVGLVRCAISVTGSGWLSQSARVLKPSVCSGFQCVGPGPPCPAFAARPKLGALSVSRGVALCANWYLDPRLNVKSPCQVPHRERVAEKPPPVPGGGPCPMCVRACTRDRDRVGQRTGISW